MRVSSRDPPAVTGPDATVVMIARTRRVDQLEYHAPAARRANTRIADSAFSAALGAFDGPGTDRRWAKPGACTRGPIGGSVGIEFLRIGMMKLEFVVCTTCPGG